MLHTVRVQYAVLAIFDSAVLLYAVLYVRLIYKIRSSEVQYSTALAEYHPAPAPGHVQYTGIFKKNFFVYSFVRKILYVPITFNHR